MDYKKRSDGLAALDGPIPWGICTGTVGLPSWLSAFVILIESVSAVLLIIGFAGRINAALMGIVMAGAFFVDHLPNGFFMNWFGTSKGEGYEFDILFWAISIILVINGSGKWSIDRWILSRTDGFSSNKPLSKPAVL